jgi:hypothetical protein
MKPIVCNSKKGETILPGHTAAGCGRQNRFRQS